MLDFRHGRRPQAPARPAGFGTGFMTLSITVVSKQLLPVFNKPMIYCLLANTKTQTMTPSSDVITMLCIMTGNANDRHFANGSPEAKSPRQICNHQSDAGRLGTHPATYWQEHPSRLNN